MCVGAIKMKLFFITLLSFFSFYSISHADDLLEYGTQCKEIGFKAKTPAYGDCVLELRRRDSAKNNSSQTSIKSANSIKSSGDGSSEDKSCQSYNFEVGTDAYNQCRLQLNLAKRQFETQQSQYEQQQSQYQYQLQQYQAQVAALEKEKERRKNLNLMELGLRMMAGQSMTDASMATAGMLPIQPQAPSRPAFENYSVTMPGGRTTNCSYNTVMRSMNCR
jgi:hypothetical protein